VVASLLRLSVWRAAANRRGGRVVVSGVPGIDAHAASASSITVSTKPANASPAGGFGSF